MGMMFLGPCANAAEPKDTIAMNRNLTQVVVTGTGTHSKAKDAVIPVKVLTAEDLRKAHATSLEQALVMLTPSITTMTNGMGTTMMMNGLNEDYILILENGKRLTGDDRYTRINMANIKRIEVLNGASSALYGSEAIGGVINIITEGSNMYSKGESREHVNVTNQTQVSSKNRLTESISADVTKGHFSSSTGFQYRQAGNWQVNSQELVNNVLKPTGRVMSQGFHSNQLNQRLAWDFGKGLSVYARGSYYDYKTDRPQQATYFKGSKFTETPAYTYDLDHENYLYGAGATWKVNNKVYLEADFYADNLTSERDSFDTYRKGGKQLTKRTHYYNGTVKGIFRLGDWNKLSAGVEYVHETYEAYNLSFHRTYTLSVFAQDEMRIIKDLNAVLGVRYIEDKNFGSYATPSVALMYSPGPVRLRANYSTGYRTPTLVQTYYENDETKNITIGNTDLAPEKSNFYSLNAEYNSKWMTVHATAFMNDVRDMISYRVMPDAEVAERGLDVKYPTATKYQQRDNVDRAKVKGVTVGTTFFTPVGLKLGGSYTYTHAKQRNTTLNASTQLYEVALEPTDRSMRHTGHVFADWAHTWRKYTLDVNLNGHLQGKRWSTSYGYAPHYAQFDLSTTHTWHMANVDLEPGIGIENILNKRDTRPWCSNFSTLHPGRCLYASFAVKFKK